MTLSGTLHLPLVSVTHCEDGPEDASIISLEEGGIKIGQNTIIISRSRLDMGNKKIVNLAAPTAASDAATKAYVDARPGLQFAGYTTTTYTGALGYAKGANEKCHAAYSGSHWCSVNEIMELGNQYPWTYTVWVRDAVRGFSFVYWGGFLL